MAQLSASAVRLASAHQSAQRDHLDLGPTGFQLVCNALLRGRQLHPTVLARGRAFDPHHLSIKPGEIIGQLARSPPRPEWPSPDEVIPN
jgi:hypothetical protein